MLPGVPNQPKAPVTHVSSFLQSPLKDGCVRILAWGRRNESPRFYFALEHTALLNELMRFRGGQPPGKRSGWGGAKSRGGEENG